MHTVYYLSDLAYAVSDALFMPFQEAKERLRAALASYFDAYNPNDNNPQEE